jgi:hypothetical protein
MPLSYGWLSSLGNMERMKTNAMGAHESIDDKKEGGKSLG